jgi:hypothetical protein
MADGGGPVARFEKILNRRGGGGGVSTRQSQSPGAAQVLGSLYRIGTRVPYPHTKFAFTPGLAILPGFYPTYPSFILPGFTLPGVEVQCTVEGGSVNRCFQVRKVSRKVRYGKPGRRRRPAYVGSISTARGNMQEESCGFSAAQFSRFEIALFCTRYGYSRL